MLKALAFQLLELLESTSLFKVLVSFANLHPYSATQATLTMKSLTVRASEAIVGAVPESERKLAQHAAQEAAETGMTDVLWLLFTSVLAVTLVSKIPGGSPVLGFLIGGACIGPHTLGLIAHVDQVNILAEFGRDAQPALVIGRHYITGRDSAPVQYNGVV